MRLIFLDRLKEGDIIGEDIVDSNGAALLRKGSKFKEAYRKKMEEAGIEEVYKDDLLSKEIIPKKLISSPIRKIIKKDMQNQFKKLKKNMILDYEIIDQAAIILMEQLSKEEVFVEMRDLRINHIDTYEHSISVAIMALLTCRKMNINLEHTQKIVAGALMHDIGKTVMSKKILNKSTALTEEEYKNIKQHPIIGYNMIKDQTDIHSIIKVIILCHHEREDGSGYPLGKKEDLYIGAKIVAACDVFHTLLSDKNQKKGLPLDLATRVARKEKLNPEIRKAVESILAFYPVGTIVKLSTGDIGIVEKNFAGDLKRPEVKIVNTHIRSREINWKINLQKESNVFIVSKLPCIPDVD